MWISGRVKAAHFVNNRESWRQIQAVCSLLRIGNNAYCRLASVARKARYDPRSIFCFVGKRNSRRRDKNIEISGIRGVEHEDKNVAFSRC